MLDRRRIVVLLVLFLGFQVGAQDVYRDWNRRACPILDTPYRTYRSLHITHHLGTDTGTVGWGDRVSVTDVAFWGRFPSWENDLGGELELRGHMDLRVLEGLASGSRSDRQHSFLMLRGKAVWHQRYWGGVGLQVRMQPGIYTALSKPSSRIFSIPVGGNLIYAITPDVAVFAGVDYYPDFAVAFDPVGGVVYSRYDEVMVQLAYPETRLTMRPYGGRLQLGMGATFTRGLDYRLGRDDERERIRFRENQAYGELSWDTHGFTQIDLRAGYTFRRRAIFPEGPSIAFDDTPFVSLGFSALF